MEGMFMGKVGGARVRLRFDDVVKSGRIES